MDQTFKSPEASAEAEAASASADAPLSARVDAVLDRLRAWPKGERSRLAELAGVHESSLRTMAAEDYAPRPVINLIRLERAFAAIDGEG